VAIYSFEGKTPSIAPSAFVHPEATLIGEVVVGEGCFVGPGARLRGDLGPIIIGAGSNVQDNCVMHCLAEHLPVRLGPNCHIGHGAIIHSAVLGYHVTVGMGAIIMDEVEIGDECIIGAGALVTSRTVIPAAKKVLGVPARIVGDVSPEMQELLTRNTGVYHALVRRYRLEG
jgi:carbonic anhydrase/acetyltransferase-like protein (isoleucine patch superfamily)